MLSGHTRTGRITQSAAIGSDRVPRRTVGCHIVRRETERSVLLNETRSATWCDRCQLIPVRCPEKIQINLNIIFKGKLRIKANLVDVVDVRIGFEMWSDGL